MSQCDILIIGAGPGGYVAAEEAARLGKKVTVIEKNSIGGTCLNVGCIPSKAYLEHAHWLLAAKEASQYGVTVLNDNLDFQKLVARKDQVVATLQSGIQSSFKQLGITYIEGEAVYISDKTLQVNGERVSGKSVILATGSHPFIPPIPGINDVDYLTTDNFFNLKELPQRLLIIGGGIISVELAFAMAPLGVDVTVIEVAPTILATEDDEARSIIREKMKQLGITILEGVSIDRVKENVVILADGKSYSYDNLLVATGRKPNIELAQMMGLELTEKGFIKVDSYYESSQSGVYAIGDLIPGYMLAHVASSESKLFEPFVVRLRNRLIIQVFHGRSLQHQRLLPLACQKRRLYNKDMIYQLVNFLMFIMVEPLRLIQQKVLLKLSPKNAITYY